MKLRPPESSLTRRSRATLSLARERGLGVREFLGRRSQIRCLRMAPRLDSHRADDPALEIVLAVEGAVARDQR
jgi:hypothetical protein